MKHIIKFGLLSVMVVLWLACGAVLAAPAAPVKPRQLSVVIPDDIYPYAYRDNNQQPVGLLVDLWHEIAAAGKVPLLLKMANRAEIVDLFESGQFDILGALTQTPQRAQQYLLGPLLLEVYSNVFIHRDLQQIENLQQLQPLVIGVINNSSQISALSAAVPGATLRKFENTSDMYEAAVRGEIKAFSGLDRLNPRYSQYKQLIDLFPLYKKLPLQKIEIGYAVLPAKLQLSRWLHQLIDDIPAKLMDKLQRRWLSGVNDEETILLSLPTSNQPLVSVSPLGKPQGLLVDLWRLWSEQTGIPIAFMPDTTPGGLKALQQGRIDAHMAYPVGGKPPEGVLAAYPIYGVNSAFYFPKFQGYTDFNQVDLPVGVFTTASYIDQLQQDYPAVRTKVFNKLEQLMSAIDKREIAGFFGAELVTQQRLLLNQSDTFQKLAQPVYPTQLQVLVREGNSTLADKIRRGFAAISQDQLEQLERRWLTEPMNGYFYRSRLRVPLSEQEHSWLKQHPTIRVGVRSNWKPMEFVDEDGQTKGVSVAMLQKLSERLGTKFVAVPYENWPLLVEDLRNGKIDIGTNLLNTMERKQFASFTDDFWPMQWALISNQRNGAVQSLAELSGKKIAMLKGYQLQNYLKQHHPDITIIQLESFSQGIEMLQNGQTDYMAEALVVASTALNNPAYLNLRLHVPADLPTYPTLYGVRKDWPELLGILEKGIKTLTEQERSAILQPWMQVDMQQAEAPSERMLTLILQIVAAALILFLVVFFWNMSLRREVSLRRDMESKMRFMATHDDLTQLANRSLLQERLTQAIYQHARHHEKLALLFIDLDGFKAVNDQYGHHIGDELLVRVAEILRYCVRKSDTVARFGGDEFVILLTAMLDKDDAAIVAEKILLQLETPLQLSACQAQIGASIGIALYPDDGTDESTMLKAADSLMYLAKAAGKGQYRFSHERQ